MKPSSKIGSRPHIHVWGEHAGAGVSCESRLDACSALAPTGYAIEIGSEGRVEENARHNDPYLLGAVTQEFCSLSERLTGLIRKAATKRADGMESSPLLTMCVHTYIVAPESNNIIPERRLAAARSTRVTWPTTWG
jgi:hypothetical protein